MNILDLSARAIERSQREPKEGLERGDSYAKS